MMRATTVVLALALPGLLVSATGAQEYAPAADTSVVIGCLQTDSQSGGFTLVGRVSDGEGEEGEKTNYGVRGVVPPGVDLSSHVGHRVQVAGAIVDGSSPDERPAVHMHSFEHVAAECS